jgi:adenosylcobinamide-GDP ribazoletransferase
MKASWPQRIAADVRTSILVCTRLPLGLSAAVESIDVTRASWALPVAGAVVGGAGASAFWLASELRLPPAIAAAFALAATLLITGCMHEDGLADTADGFGGGWDRARKLEIMRDSRLGTYGACALGMSLLLRWAALAAFTSSLPAAAALMAAHVGARAALPAFMHMVPPARADGLAAQAGRPSLQGAVIAGLIGVLTLALTLGLPATAFGLALAASAGFLMAGLCLRQIGGQTGDVLGALEQVIETVITLTAVVAWGSPSGIMSGNLP